MPTCPPAQGRDFQPTVTHTHRPGHPPHTRPPSTHTHPRARIVPSQHTPTHMHTACSLCVHDGGVCHMCRAGLGSRYFTEHGFRDWQAAVAADGHTLTSLGCDPAPVCHRPMKTCLFHPRVDGSDRGASTGGAAVPEPHGAAASSSPKDGEHPLVPGEEVAAGSRADGPCGRAVHPPAPALALAALDIVPSVQWHC